MSDDDDAAEGASSRIANSAALHCACQKLQIASVTRNDAFVSRSGNHYRPLLRCR